VNVGSGKDISIKDVVDILLHITGKKTEIVCEKKRLRPEKSEVNRLLCDASVARELTGWQPRYTLKEGLKITASWIEKHLHTYRTKIYNI